MNKTNLIRMPPMTIARAREIVEHAENEFANGNDIKDAFMPFSRGGATTRLEALQSLYIRIADFYHFACVRRSKLPDAMKQFDIYANGSGLIAWRIMCDHIREPSKIPDALRSQETVSSFVAYVRTLDPTAVGFWHNIYQRIGLDYPLESQPLIQVPEPSAKASKPWWRFWKN